MFPADFFREPVVMIGQRSIVVARGGVVFGESNAGQLSAHFRQLSLGEFTYLLQLTAVFIIKEEPAVIKQKNVLPTAARDASLTAKAYVISGEIIRGVLFTASGK